MSSEEEEREYTYSKSEEEEVRSFEEGEGSPGFKEKQHTTREEAVGKLDVHDMFLINFMTKMKDYPCFSSMTDDAKSELKLTLRTLPNMLMLNITLLALAVCFDMTYKGIVTQVNVTEFCNVYAKKETEKQKHTRGKKQETKSKKQDFDAIDIIRYIKFYQTNK